MKSLVTKVLCQLHFHDSQFMNAHNYQRLVWNALPTLFGSDTRKPEEFKPLVGKGSRIGDLSRSKPVGQIRGFWIGLASPRRL